MEYIQLGPVPCDEDCAQVGEADYTIKARAECQRYKQLLERKFPLIPGVLFLVKSFPHDFGTYHEVVVKFDPTRKSAIDFALNVENNLPATWND